MELVATQSAVRITVNGFEHVEKMDAATERLLGGYEPGNKGINWVRS